MCGMYIAKQHGVRSALRSSLDRLEAELKNLEQQHTSPPAGAILVEIKQKHTEFIDASELEVKHSHKYAHARVYGEAERSSRTLAILLRYKRHVQAIAQLRKQDGTMMHNACDILTALVDYYPGLYTSQVSR
ncbi:hypothetical protein NDU88_000815 [Pleurodeles waltl]|uniref:Uncharacterized protein n=1 Tax=Pleurodeles waltl TaxID=8319 RepID=A0AAV7S8A3_PLEWA|nr:hypothetical protein NDU88_000815 [Pleurodeles waltl]